VVLFWQILAAVQDDFTLLPSPADVLPALRDLAQSGELMRHISASSLRLLVGWGLGAGCGVVPGFAIGPYPAVRSSALPIVSAMFATPKIALLPLFVVWFGIGEVSKIATIAVGVFAPMAVATYAGVDAVDRNLIRMAQSFNLPTSCILRTVLLPGALALTSGNLMRTDRLFVAVGILALTGR